MAGRRDRRFLSYNIHKVRRKRLFFFIRFILLLFLVYHIITVFLITPYTINTVSMAPTIQSGEKILVSPIWYGPFLPLSGTRVKDWAQPKRGDIVLLSPPEKPQDPLYIRIFDPVIRFFTLQQYSLRNNPEKVYWETPLLVKRIIAVPGDTVKVEDSIAYIRTAGETEFKREFEVLKKEYSISENTNYSIPLYEALFGSYPETLLAEGEFFFLGDNRNYSQDSRYWGLGKADNIKGKVVLSYWPKIFFR